MSVNSLIAQGGTGRSPARSFIRGRQAGQDFDRNNLAMQSTQQRMGINAENQDVEKQQRQLKGIASLAKYLDSIPDGPQREEAFKQAVEKMPQMGMEPPPFGSTYASMKPQLEMVKMQMFGEQEKWTQGKSASGTPVQTSTVSGKQIPGFEPDPIETFSPIYEGSDVVAQKSDTTNRVYKDPRAPDKVISGTPSDWNTGGAADRDLREGNTARETVYQLHGAVDSIIKDLEGATHYVGGPSGNIVRMINSGSQQFDQLRNKPDDLMTDGKFNMDRLGKISKENASWLRKAAMDTGTIDSAILELAFTHAKYLNQSGKISDADIRAARDIIEEPDRAIAVQKLTALKNRSTRNYNMARKARKDKTNWYELDLGGTGGTGGTGAGAGGSSDDDLVNRIMGVQPQ